MCTMKPTLLGRMCFCVPLLAFLAGPSPLTAQTSIIDYPDFSSVAGLGLQGNALQVGNRLRLASASPSQAGGVWVATRRFVSGGFETVFQFQISARGGEVGGGGGEGFALVVQNNALPALGLAGDGLGYEGVPASLAVEFDLRQNPAWNDPNANHISVHTQRGLPNGADHTNSLGAVVSGLPDLADGNVHTGKVVYAGSTLQVFVDDLANPVLSLSLPSGDPGYEGSLEELLGLDDGQAWIGFTATTSDAFENHDLLSWSFAPAPSPLTVTLTSPRDGASYLCPARILLQADALSPGTVTRVDFYQGTTKLGQADHSPWQFEWDDVLPGAYWLTAAATDDADRRSVSPRVKVIVYPESPPIGINFCTGANGASYPLAMPEQAGVVEQRLWNNLTSPTNGSGSVFNLKNGAGVNTGVDVGWDFAGPAEESSVNPDLSSHHKLMKPYLADDGGTGGGQSNSVIVVQQIPFETYDVLVYSDSANGLADCVAEFRLSTNDVLYLRDAAGASFAGAFVEAEGTSDQGVGTPAGDYVRFNSLTNSSFTLTVTARSASGGPPRAAVNALQIVPSLNAAPPQVTRGPYLQMATPTSMVVRWRTSRVADSRLRYGLSPAALNLTNDNLTLTTEHIVTLTNLQPYTTYYYAVGTTDTNLVGGGDCYFTTFPTHPVPTRIWFISDYGVRNPEERAVRNSYFNYLDQTETRPADVWITGGDNDQTDGRDSNYQISVFGTDFGYGNLLRHLPVWPTIGNHDYQTARGQAYYANFSLPTQGEAGGVPSDSEHYYSFNYGDVHFVSLDSVDGSLSASPDTPMFQWLRQDLASVTQRWIIAYWHAAPYTKGSHDSDSDSDTIAWMGRMRENAVPILESYGVDLVLNGHSHVYERTWLINGHYGYSDTFSEANKIDGGDGRVDGTGAYLKPAGGAGTVYVTAAVGGQPRNTMDAVHPAHLLKITGILGSLMIDVNGNRLDLQYLNTNGVALDYFTIIKDPLTPPPAAPTGLAGSAIGGNQIQLTWNNTPTNEMRFVVERSTDGVNFALLATVGANLTCYIDTSPPLGLTCYYRLRAWNNAGESAYSSLATASLVQPLRITSLRPASDTVTLNWYSVPGQTYAIEWTDSLASPNWQAISSDIVATNYSVVWQIPLDSNQPMGFYRITTTGN